jgi:hypothetical protein
MLNGFLLKYIIENWFLNYVIPIPFFKIYIEIGDGKIDKIC